MKIKSACLLLSALVSSSSLMAYRSAVCEKGIGSANHVKVTFERLPHSKDYRITHSDKTGVTKVISKLHKIKRSENKRKLSCSDKKRKTRGFIMRSHPTGGYMFGITENADTLQAETKLESFSVHQCFFDMGIWQVVQPFQSVQALTRVLKLKPLAPALGKPVALQSQPVPAMSK